MSLFNTADHILYTDLRILQNLKSAFERIIDPVTLAIRREVSSIIAKLHRVDFAKPVDPTAGMGGLSLYLKELTDKLSFIKTELIMRYNLGEFGQTWSVTL